MNETSLKYEVTLPNDGTHDEGLSLRPRSGSFGEEEHNIVIDPSDKSFFQRIKIYSNGLVTSEEVRRDNRVIRFNVPYELEDGVYILDI